MRILLAFLLFTTLHADPLPSWNEGIAKKSIVDFVTQSTQEGSESYIPPQDRIATFDEDGTLWVEHPVYTEFFFVLDQAKELMKRNPSLVNTEPYKTLASGNLEAIKNLSHKDIEILVNATHSNITVEDFITTVKAWLKTARHPRFKKPFTQLVYKPMLEVMQYLKDNQFEVYIVSGGGQEFIRAFAEEVYGLPPSHVIGTAEKVKYDYRDGKPVLQKSPELMLMDNFGGKPEGINLMIGKKPVIAFGNSTGDQQMLEWTQSNKGKTLELLVHHDDAVREYAYGPDTKVGTFSQELMDEAKKQGWIVISMKDDWKVIFPWE